MSWRSLLLGALLGFASIGGAVCWYWYHHKEWTDVLQGTVASAGKPLPQAKLRLVDITSEEKAVRLQTTSDGRFRIVRHFRKPNWILIETKGARYGKLYMDTDTGERLLWQDLRANSAGAEISETIACDLAVPVVQSWEDHTWVRITQTAPENTADPVFCHPASVKLEMGPAN